MKVTSDLWFTAFLRLKGFEVKDFEVVSKHKGRYHFDITDEEWKKLKFEFVNHDASKIKQFFSELRDLLY